jgi:hypothetical protein
MIDYENNLYFQHRHNLPLRDDGGTREHLIELIDELLDLEAQTHPSAGDCPNKQELSRHGSMCAEDLLQTLFGWSVDHEIGLVLNGLPGGVPTLFDDLEDGDRRRASEHVHEAKAAEYLFMEDDPQTDRKMLRALLNAESPIPAKLLVQVLTALDSIQLGEQAEFFQPKRTHGQEGSPYSKQMLRLRAVEHLEFLRGMNVGREDAKGRVAEAYGNDGATVEGWNSKLPGRLLGMTHVATAKRCARNHGKAALEQLFNGDPSLKDQEAEALQRDGAAFQELTGTPDGKVVPIS